jgi:excisionase family DNA binding protein
MDPEPDVLTIEELAVWLRCAYSTIYRQIKAGKLPGFRVSKKWRFNRAQIREWIVESTKTSKTAVYPPRTKRLSHSTFCYSREF